MEVEQQVKADITDFTEKAISANSAKNELAVAKYASCTLII
ncbi:hypothetical protein [Limosilactobacillus reuteri]|nr:hypothetical protein [Limosilactobacillus reuteri]